MTEKSLIEAIQSASVANLGKAVAIHPVSKAAFKFSMKLFLKSGSSMHPISRPRIILEMISMVSALQALVMQMVFADCAQRSTLLSSRSTLPRIAGASSWTRVPDRAGVSTLRRIRLFAGSVSPIDVPGNEMHR